MHHQMAEATPILDFQGVQITRHEHIIFEDFSLRLEAGEFVYLTGPVGVGKSTLLKTIYAEVPIKQGHAMVLGMDLVQVTRRTLPDLRRRIGIVFQDFRLLPDLDVYNNLDIVLRAFGFGRGADRRARIQEVLQEVGLERKDYKYPHELSGGEQQRVCIARALIGGPDLILADEPTGNLDAENGLGIVELLHHVARERGTAVLMATHNRLVLERFPARCIEMDSL